MLFSLLAAAAAAVAIVAVTVAAARRVNCAFVRTHFPECVRVVVALLLLRYLGDRESLHLSVQAFFASLCTWMMQNEAWAFF